MAWKPATPQLELGSHFSHFCAALGIPPTTGPRGSLPMLREQLQRLFASTFQCIFHDESQGRHAGDGFLIAEKRELWWDPRPGKGEAAWGSHVLLSDRFFREATEAPVPLDLRVLRALRSPFEIDIYQARRARHAVAADERRGDEVRPPALARRQGAQVTLTTTSVVSSGRREPRAKRASSSTTACRIWRAESRAVGSETKKARSAS